MLMTHTRTLLNLTLMLLCLVGTDRIFATEDHSRSSGLLPDPVLTAAVACLIVSPSGEAVIAGKPAAINRGGNGRPNHSPFE